MFTLRGIFNISSTSVANESEMENANVQIVRIKNHLRKNRQRFGVNLLKTGSQKKINSNSINRH